MQTIEKSLIEKSLESAEKLLKIPAEYWEGDHGVCGVNFSVGWFHWKATSAYIDDVFVSLPEDVQESALYHELGHIVSYENKLPAHAKDIRHHRWWFGLLSDRCYYNRECEADTYAAERIGINRVLGMLSVALRGNDERTTRLANLKAVWEKRTKL